MDRSNCNFCKTTDSMRSCSTNCYLNGQESQAINSQLNRITHEKEIILSSNLNNNRIDGRRSVHMPTLIENKFKSKEEVKESVKLNKSRIPVLEKSNMKFSVHDGACAFNYFSTNYPLDHGSSGDAVFDAAAFQNKTSNEIICMSVKQTPKIRNFDPSDMNDEVEGSREKKRLSKSRQIYTLNERIESVKTTSLYSFRESERLSDFPPSNPQITLNSTFDKQVLCQRSHSDFEYEKLLGSITKLKTKDKLTTLSSIVSGIERNTLVDRTFISELQILISTEGDQEIYKVVDSDEIEILLPNYSVDIIISKVYRINKHNSSNIVSHYVNEIKELVVTKNIDLKLKTFLANIFCSHQEAEVRFLAVNRTAYQLWNENKKANKSGLDRRSVQTLKELLVQLIHTRDVLFQSERRLKNVIERCIQAEDNKEEMIKALSVHKGMIETALRTTDEFATIILSQKVEELIRNLKEFQSTISTLLMKNDQLAVQNAELVDWCQNKGKVSNLGVFKDGGQQSFDKNERLKERIVLVQKRLHAIQQKLEKSEIHNASLLDELQVLRSQLDSERRSAQSTQANLQLEIACIKRINTGRESALRQASAAGDGLLKDISRIEQSLMKAGKKIQLLPQEMLISCSNSFIDFVATCTTCIKILSQELISTLDTVSNLKSRLDIITVDNTYVNQCMEDLKSEIAQLKGEISKLQQMSIRVGKHGNLCVQNSTPNSSGQADLMFPSSRHMSDNKGQENQELIHLRDTKKDLEKKLSLIEKQENQEIIHLKDTNKDLEKKLSLTEKQENQEIIHLKDTNKDLEKKLSLAEKRCEELTQELGVVYKENESLMLALQDSNSKMQSSETVFRELQKENKILIEDNKNLTEKLVAAMNLLSYSKKVVENLDKKKAADSSSSKTQ